MNDDDDERLVDSASKLTRKKNGNILIAKRDHRKRGRTNLKAVFLSTVTWFFIDYLYLKIYQIFNNSNKSLTKSIVNRQYPRAA